MSRRDKLIERLRNNPKNIDFSILKKLLEDEGYEGFNSGGSHWVFRKEGYVSVTIPYKRPVKIMYVKKVLEILESQEVER